jgi:hypothetical protein
MVTRLRPALGILAAVALLSVGSLSLVASDTAPSGDRHDVVAVAKASTAGSAAPTRAPGAPVVPLLALAVLMTLAGTGSTQVPALIGRQRRRPGDDGDDWRSLLLGAPPGLA